MPSKPPTKEVSNALQQLETDVGTIAAHSIYCLIEAVIVEERLPGTQICTAIEAGASGCVRDELFAALRLAIPSATHDQLLAAVKAIEALVSAKALEVMSL